MSSIVLSREHGLNPTIPKCWFCGEDKNEILLPGVKGDRIARKLGYSDGQMPIHGLVFDKHPCDKCQQWMQQGIILISVDERKSIDAQNPYRTGKFCVIKDDAMRRLLDVDIPEGLDEETHKRLLKQQRQNGELLEYILKARVAFIPDEVWTAVGLPTTNTPEKEDESTTG